LAFFFYLFGHGGLPVTDSRPRASLAENERARTRSLGPLRREVTAHRRDHARFLLSWEKMANSMFTFWIVYIL